MTPTNIFKQRKIPNIRYYYYLQHDYHHVIPISL